MSELKPFCVDPLSQQESRSIYLELPSDLHKRFKLAARKHNISMQRLGQQMIRHCVQELEATD